METKKRIIRDYEKLSSDMKRLINKVYPDGFENHLVCYKVNFGKSIKALPIETSTEIILVRSDVKFNEKKKHILSDYEQVKRLNDYI